MRDAMCSGIVYALHMPCVHSAGMCLCGPYMHVHMVYRAYVLYAYTSYMAIYICMCMVYTHSPLYGACDISSYTRYQYALSTLSLSTLYVLDMNTHHIPLDHPRTIPGYDARSDGQ
jgi:hypothetical protein